MIKPEIIFGLALTTSPGRASRICQALIADRGLTVQFRRCALRRDEAGVESQARAVVFDARVNPIVDLSVHRSSWQMGQGDIRALQ